MNIGHMNKGIEGISCIKMAVIRHISLNRRSAYKRFQGV